MYFSPFKGQRLSKQYFDILLLPQRKHHHYKEPIGILTDTIDDFACLFWDSNKLRKHAEFLNVKEAYHSCEQGDEYSNYITGREFLD